MRATLEEVAAARAHLTSLDPKALMEKYENLLNKQISIDVNCKTDSGAIDWKQAGEKHGIGDMEAYAKSDADIRAMNEIINEDRRSADNRRFAESELENLVPKAQPAHYQPQNVTLAPGQIILDSLMNQGVTLNVDTDMVNALRNNSLRNIPLSFLDFMRPGRLLMRDPGMGGLERFQNATMTQTGSAAGIRAVPWYETSFVAPLEASRLGAARIFDVYNNNGADTFNFPKVTARTPADAAPVAPVAEADNAAEVDATVGWTEINLRKLAIILDIHKFNLRNPFYARSVLNNEMALQVSQAIEQQLLNGPGSGNTWLGLLAVTGVQSATQAQNTWGIDMITNAFAGLAQYEGFMPTHILMNPADAWKLMGMRVGSDRADLAYRMGINADNDFVLYGKPIIQCSRLAAGNALIVDNTMFGLAEDGYGFEMDFTNAHGENFRKGILSFSIDGRANTFYKNAKGIYHIKAFDAGKKA